MSWKTFDRVAVRLLLAVLFLLIAFVVTQPLLWRLLFPRNLPKNFPGALGNAGTLMGVVVTILSIAIAGFGTVAYKTLSEVLEKRLNDQIEEEVKDHVVPRLLELVDKEIQERVVPPMNYGLARIHLLESVRLYEEYQRRWKDGGYDAALVQSGPVSELLGRALGDAEEALRLADGLPESADGLPESDEYAWVKLAAVNNLAYHLATRKAPKDRDRVLGYAKRLEPYATNHHHAETLAWVWLRYGTPGDDLWARGVKMARNLSKREEVAPDWVTNLRDKYTRLFGDVFEA